MHTKFEYINPVLSSSDIERDVAWYKEKLGFRLMDNDDDPANYAVLGRQNVYLHLQSQTPTDMAKTNGAVVRIQVKNIRPLLDEFITRGTITAEKFKENTAWGTNEFGLFDLNSNALFFYESAGEASKQTESTNAAHPGVWFERPFNFEQLSISPQGLLERLRYTPLRIREQLQWLTPSQLIQRPSELWSVQENIGHLLDLEPLWYGRVHDIVSGKKIMRPADLSNQKTHDASHNTQTIERLFRAFAAERNKLIALCETHHAMLAIASALHPRLQKPMRIIDLMYFVAEHDDHHIATIRHLMGKIGPALPKNIV